MSVSKTLDEFIDVELTKAFHQGEKAERKNLAEYFIHNAWHEKDCPAHSNQMGKESDCDCIFSLIQTKLKENL